MFATKAYYSCTYGIAHYVYRLGMFATKRICTTESGAADRISKLDSNVAYVENVEKSSVFIDDVMIISSQSDTEESVLSNSDCEIISEIIYRSPLNNNIISNNNKNNNSNNNNNNNINNKNNKNNKNNNNSNSNNTKLNKNHSWQSNQNIHPINDTCTNTPKPSLKQTTILSWFYNNNFPSEKTHSNSQLNTKIDHQKREYSSLSSDDSLKLNKFANHSTEEILLNKSELPVCSKQQKRPCPEHKRIPNTKFTVDAFSYGLIPGCSCYFLTHFHSDHYMGLTNKFSQPIYCTQTTANLVTHCIKVDSRYINCLDFNTEYTIDNVKVTFIDANHCPGSAMILFKLPSGECYLHTGDFRANQIMLQNSVLLDQRIDRLFLDTTYCNPQHTFPTQEDVIQYTVNLCLQFIQYNPNGKIFVGSYLIGKERIFLAIAKALDCKICVSDRKFQILNCFEWEELKARLTSDITATALHVVNMAALSWPGIMELKNKFDESAILAFQPTGWKYTKNNLSDIKPRKIENILVYDVPYSEHSSYNELKRFIKFFKPTKVIPTVNVKENEHMSDIFKLWTCGGTS